MVVRTVHMKSRGFNVGNYYDAAFLARLYITYPNAGAPAHASIDTVVLCVS